MTYATALRSGTGLRLLYLKLICTALLWGGTFVAGRMLANEIDPVTAALGRFGLALCVLLLFVVHQHGRLPLLNKSQMLGTLGLGATGVFLYNVFFFAALAEMPASRTALFVAFTPIIVAILARFFTQTPLEKGSLLGICIALFGVLIVVTDGALLTTASALAQSVGIGEVFMTIATISWALYTVLGHSVLRDISPLVATTYAAGWGVVLLLILWSVNGQSVDWQAVNWSAYAAIVYLALGGTVIPFIWYSQGVALIGAARAAIFTNLVPIFGVLLGFILLQEPLNLAMAIGGALTILGVYWTNMPPLDGRKSTNLPPIMLERNIGSLKTEILK